MSVATFQPAAVVYREEQNFDWWAYAVVVVVELALWFAVASCFETAPHHAAPTLLRSLERPLGLVVLALPVVILVGLLHMTTEVTPSVARVWFGWIPTYRRVVPIGTIQRLEVVNYRPLADYWGWGIRSGRDGERVHNARGYRGVRLDLADGSRLLIGSQRPEALARAIERAMLPSL